MVARPPARARALAETLGLSLRAHVPVRVVDAEGRLRGPGRPGPVRGLAVVLVETDSHEQARRAVQQAGLGAIDIAGRVGDGDDRVLAVVGPEVEVAPSEPPPGFRVLAFVPARNEADILSATTAHLLEQSVDVVVLDNWSTDGTVESLDELRRRVGARLVVQQFPPEGPNEFYEWRRTLDRIASLAAVSGADWCMLNDADELRTSPWPRWRLREALWEVQQRGYNAVNHTVLMMVPVDDSFEVAHDPLSIDRWSRAVGAGRTQVKAWRNGGIPVDLATSGGHEARFLGRSVFPYRFLQKHYAIRSQAHGERKVAERLVRFSAEERRLGWHHHYDGLDSSHSFLGDPDRLPRWNSRSMDDLFVERLVDYPSASIPRGVRRRALLLADRVGVGGAARSWARSVGLGAGPWGRQQVSPSGRARRGRRG